MAANPLDRELIPIPREHTESYGKRLHYRLAAVACESRKQTRALIKLKEMGPLHEVVTSHRIHHFIWQKSERASKTKGLKPVKLDFSVLDVPVISVISNLSDVLPCDGCMQRAH